MTVAGKGGKGGATCFVFTSYPQHPPSLPPRSCGRPTMSTDPDRERLLDNDELDSPSEPMFVFVLPLSTHHILRLTNIRILAAQPVDIRLDKEGDYSRHRQPIRAFKSVHRPLFVYDRPLRDDYRPEHNGWLPWIGLLHSRNHHQHQHDC
jgi:hypothetical protein